jgi:hypothetical protein
MLATVTRNITGSLNRVSRDLPGASDEEREAAQAAALGLSLKQFRALRASLEALRAR